MVGGLQRGWSEKRSEPVGLARESLSSISWWTHGCRGFRRWISKIDFSLQFPPSHNIQRRKSHQRVVGVEEFLSVINANWAWTIFAFDAVELAAQDRWTNADVYNTSWACNDSYWRVNIPTVDASWWCDNAHRWKTLAVDSRWRSGDSGHWLEGNFIEKFWKNPWKINSRSESHAWSCGMALQCIQSHSWIWTMGG